MFSLDKARLDRARQESARRGSVSMDFVFASLIFILILGFTAISYSNYLDAYKIAESKKSLEASALSISETLIKSSGYPRNWEQNVSAFEIPGLGVLGLAGQENENVLDPNKVTAFSTLSYNATRNMFGFDGDYYISIKSVDGKTFFSKGTEYADSSSVAIERIVLFNQSVCRLTVRLYG